MDVADDADGRVAIFSVDAPDRPDAVATPPPLPHHPRPAGLAERLGALLDSAYAGIGIAVMLAVILVLGLVLTRH